MKTTSLNTDYNQSKIAAAASGPLSIKPSIKPAAAASSNTSAIGGGMINSGNAIGMQQTANGTIDATDKYTADYLAKQSAELKAQTDADAKNLADMQAKINAANKIING